jgi:hypothetical protein
MRLIPRGLGLIVAGALLYGMMPGGVALASSEPQIQVVVRVNGYEPGFGLIFGSIACGTLSQPIEFGVAVNDGLGTSADLEAPIGDSCLIADVRPDTAGHLGQWGGWSIEPAGPVTIPPTGNTVFTITIERYYNGNEPNRDAGMWFAPDLFTVDRVYLNKTGGITAEGLVSCRTMAEAVPDFVRLTGAYIGINWTATQYVGRKTAIHGSYGSDIANSCYDPARPSQPVRWRSMHPGPGNEAVTAWVYGVDGRFAAGTIIIEGDAYNRMPTISQWWDPTRDDYSAACSTTPRSDGWYDVDGDGFCSFDNEFGLRATFVVKTTAVKTR